MAFTLTIGSFDLTPYVRLGKEDGFDPYDSSGFEEPAFVDNPFGEGQALSNVDSRNREMVWPLYLNSSSKDALHTLIRDLNREIRYGTQPLRVAWRDQDASYTTYYDVEFARLDPSFSFRHSAQGWLAGTLRVWTKPFGHTGVWRTVATSGATSQVGTYVMDDLAGDMDAQVRVVAGASRPLASSRPLTTIVSAVPYGWKPWYSGTQFFYGATALSASGDDPTFGGASGSIGSQVVSHVRAGGDVGEVVMGVATVLASQLIEPARVLALFSCTAQRPHFFRVPLDYGAAPTVVATPVASSGWLLADLGVLAVRDIDSLAGDPEVHVRVGAGSWGATTLTVLNGLFVLPENRTAVVMAASAPGTEYASINSYGVATDVLDGDDGRAHRRFYTTAAPARVAMEVPLLGQVPHVAPHASEALFVAQVGGGLVANNYQLNTSVAVRERFTYSR